MEPKRCIIFIPSDGSTYERMDDPEGDWIYDPDHKIDLRDITSRQSRAARRGAFDKFDQQFKDGKPKPFLFT